MAGQFRDGTGLTMFTSDVSARGVDYPDVTLVLQVICYTPIQQALQQCCCIVSPLVINHGWSKILSRVVHSFCLCALHSCSASTAEKLVCLKAAQWSQSLSTGTTSTLALACQLCTSPKTQLLQHRWCRLKRQEMLQKLNYKNQGHNPIC